MPYVYILKYGEMNIFYAFDPKKKWLCWIMAVFFSGSVPVFAQTNSITESYAFLRVNGSNLTLDMQATTSLQDLNGLNLGTFAIGTHSLVVRGGQQRTSKCSGGTVTASRFLWRVWATASGPSGAFTTIDLTTVIDEPGGCGGNQSWQSTSGTYDLIGNLMPGNYTLEAYTAADGSPSNLIANNGGANYRATFTVAVDSSKPVLVTSSSASNPLIRAVPNLGTAFLLVNQRSVTDAITIYIAGNTTESSVARLYGSTASAGDYTSVSIRPYGGAARTVAGNIAGQMIVLDGADFVTFDGLNTDGNSLTLRNSSTSFLPGTSTLEFVNDARWNTIANCNISGSSTTALTLPGGTICFGAGTSSGNSNNTISNCNIGPAVSVLPTKAIYGGGSGISNAYVTLTNNNIFNFFSASSDSSGIYVAGGCDLWTIENNRFYQSVARTFSGNALNCAINIAGNTSGISGFNITGNIIGYANASQSGTYTLSGGAGRFMGIFCNTVVTPLYPSSITSNTIAKVSLTGVTSSGTGNATPFAGIVTGAGKISVNANMVGSMLAGSLTFATTNPSDTEIYGICALAYEDFTSNANQVGGITASNSAVGQRFGLRGISCFQIGGSVFWSASANVIGGTTANSLQNNSLSDMAYVHGMSALTPTATLTDNTIRNLTGAGGIQIGAFTSVAGIYCENALNQIVSRNTIFALTNTNTTKATPISGIQFSGNSGNIIDRNFIYRLKAASESANVTGIFVTQGSNTFRNNIVSLGVGISTSMIFVGINEYGGNNNFYHNTIYIGGTATSGTSQSFCLTSTLGSGTHDVRNNIFSNVRTTTGFSGLHSGVIIPGSAPNPPGYTLDYNLYFVAVGNFVGIRGTVAGIDLGTWQAQSGQESHGNLSNPQFVAPTATVPNLHVKNTAATRIESRGIPLAGITDDFDGEIRSTLTPVDIGADAGVFIAVDTTAPVITYTPFPYGTVGGTRTVSGITITDDVTGVATASGSRPRLYYKKSTDPNTASGWKYVEAADGSSYDFTINYSLLASGGVSGGDVIQYFVVAQDKQSTPNVSISGGTWAVASSSVNLGTAQFPIGGTLNSYVIKDFITGNKTVCPSGCDFSSLTNEGGAFVKINASEMAGSVQLLITGNLTAETGTHALDEFIGGTAGTYRVVIKPSGAARTISGNYAGGLIRLNGADRVTIDGSLSSTTNSVCPPSRATRDLVIENTSTSAFASVIRLQNTTSSGGASNNIIRNCRIMGVAGTTPYGILCASNTASLLGSDHDNNSFINNEISRVKVGISTGGASLANKNTGTVISLNKMDAAAPDNLTTAGIIVLYDEGAVISGNTIGHVQRVSGSKAVGISLGMPEVANNYLSTGYQEVTGATVSNNLIYDIEHTGGWDAYGIVIGAISESGTNPNKVWNNSISGIRSKATPQSATFGIYVGANLGATQIYHNAISLFGTTSDSTNSYGIFVDNADPTVDIRNNIIVNKGTALSSGKQYGISFTSGTFTNVTSNNNDIFVTADGNHFAIGTGSATTPTGASLSSWTTATGKDAASVSVDPSFTSDDDLRLLAVGANNALVNAGANLSATLATDMDCATRDTTPTLGCKQLTSIPICSGSNGGTATAVAPSLCNSSGQTTITATGFSTGSNTLYQWQYATTAAFTSPVNVGTASTSYADLSTGTITATRYYRLAVTCPSTSQTGYSTIATVLVNAPVVVSVTPSTLSTCVGGSVTLTASGATTYSWSPSTGLSATTGATVTASPTVTTTYTVTGNTNGCTATTTVTVTVVPVVSSPVVSSNSPICSGSSLNLTANPVYLQGYDLTAMSGQPYTSLTASNATAVTLTSGMGTISIPSFRFNNVAYTQARVSETGVLVFGTNTGTVNSGNSSLPATVISGTGNSQAAICAHWDLNVSNVYSKIYTRTVGDEFIIAWNSYNGVGINFEIKLNTVTGAIHLVYSGAMNWGESATIGLNYGTTSGLQYSYNTTTSLNGQSLTFTPRQPTYSWSGPNGFTANTLNPVVTAAPTSAGGTYVLTATDPGSGCSASSSVTVVVKPTPEITISPSGPYCGSGATTLTASGATTYTWSPATGLTTTTGPTVTANPSVATVYTVTGTTDGCSASRSFTVFPGVSTVASSNSPRCSGDTLQLTTPTVTAANYIVDGFSNVSFVDISATGTDVPGTLGGDSNHNINFPNFVYNGVTYNTARVGNDGVVVLGTNTGSIVYSNSALPQGIGSSSSASTGLITTTGNSLAAICAYWDDLDMVAGVTSLKTQTVGDTFIIQWTDERRYGSTTNGTITFQVQLELSTGKIHIVYRDVTFNDGSGKGGSATVGLNFSATSALLFSHNTTAVADGQSLSFLPNTVTYAWTGPNGFTSTDQNPVIASATLANSGSYTVTVNNSATGCFGTATIPVVVSLTPQGGTLSGGGGMCFGAHASVLTLTGYTGTIVRWEKSETPYAEWTEVANTSPTLDPGILYNETKYRAVVQAGCGTVYSDESGFTFATTTWNGSGWTNGFPDGGKSVFFSADFTATSDIAACEVFIDSNAKVVFPATEPASSESVGSGFDLTANGVVLVAFGSLLFEQGSNLIQKDYTGPNSGNIKMKTNVKLWRQDYVYWGSPVDQDPFAMEFNAEGMPEPVTIGQTLRSFSPATLSQRFYTFDPVTNAFVSQFGPSEAIGVQNPATYTFENGKGYMVRAPNTFPNPPASPVGAYPVTQFSSQFVGVPHNGTITVPTTNGLSNAHLLSNPYPSPIQVLGPDGFLALNPGTIYLWTHHDQLPASSNYAMCNSFGSTAAYRGGVVPNGTIQVGQGFIFQNETGLPEVTFNNAMRTGNNEGQFFRKTNTASRIWLNIDNGSIRGNQMMVGYSDAATTDVDAGLDGLLMPNGTCISSLIGTSRYGIQARPAFTVNDIVPMGLRVVTSGSHTISLDHADGIFQQEQDIFLKDNQTGVVTNLKQSDYRFTSNAGDFDGRFQLQFVDLPPQARITTALDVVAYVDPTHTLTLEAGAAVMRDVTIFDIRGRLVYTRPDVQATTVRLTDLKAERQVLLVQVRMEDGAVVTKKIAY